MKLFYDLMSQPSRAVYMYLKLVNIPFEPVPVALRKGEQRTDQFKEVNRFQKVPYLHDGDFHLGESISIVRYVALKNNLDTKWYPLQLEKQARVDEYLQWHHINTRFPLTTYFRIKWRDPITTGIEPKAEILEDSHEKAVNALNQLEKIWLNHSAFLCGDEISIADVFAAAEIEQTRIAGLDPRENRAKLKNWLENVRTQTNPIYDEAHIFVNKLAEQNKK